MTYNISDPGYHVFFAFHVLVLSPMAAHVRLKTKALGTVVQASQAGDSEVTSN